MPGFDISSLVQFNPPVSRCWLCLALWPIELDMTLDRFTCPGCDSVYDNRRVTLTNTIIGSATGSSVVNLNAGDFFWSPTY